MTADDDAVCRDVGRAVVALAPYGNDLLLLGGLVPLLYRHVEGFAAAEHPAVSTTEAVLAVPRALPIVGGKGVVALLSEAGFVVGVDPKKAGGQVFQAKVQGKKQVPSQGIEFVTVLRGRSSSDLIEPQPGLRAQAVRYLDLLSHDVITLDAARVPAFGVGTSLPLRLPNPAMFVLQKVLTRDPAAMDSKRANDMAYIYDTAVLTRPIWNTLGGVMQRARGHSDEWVGWVDRGVRALDSLFASDTADGAVEAARVVRAAGTDVSDRAVGVVVRGFVAALRGITRA